ncbi:RhoGEF-domain-containing protein [Rhizopus microsporus]|uniref:RhoGEF-domain-containing protein n=1 Tax=Rhizopus microsporus TaxID=58291 RepID=A0A1X0SGJ4_RHIZD|nr:RhoGEF-domain-containing protein [Rhizopus microsporus]
MDTPPLTPMLKPFMMSPTSAVNHSGSLYHNCRSVLDKLSLIDGMTEYLDKQADTTDPLSKLTAICRQGFPLCKLYNALNPTEPLSVETDPNLNARNSCKANVYHFIVACRDKLLFPEEDMFTISDLYQDDTNGFVKVVHTINKLLQLLEERGLIVVRSSNRNSDPNAPKNTRDKVVLELLETERKYVQDMEILQNYMRELQNQKVISPDTIHYLFGNLNALVDFQRRFLIQLEEIAEKSPQEQRIGYLFLQMENSFSVYEPYCANYYSAQDLVVQETPRLMKLADILDPTYQLPSLLIKPVQRICKYPLLLQELVKSTDKDFPYYYESLEAVDAIKRVAEKVNETQRQHENVQAVQELKKRLDDLNNLPLDGFGNLLMQDKLFAMTADNHERELHAFLFERTLLLCKESKGNNILPTNTLSKKKRRGSLVPKVIADAGCISEIKSQCNKNGVWSMSIRLNEHELKQLSIKFRNEEQLKLWSAALTKVQKKALESEAELLSMQLASRTYDDYDEEDLYGDEDEEDYHSTSTTTTSTTSRSRSGSFSSHHHVMMPPLILKASQSTSVGRPHQNVPGMNLSPLPRSNSSFSTVSQNHCNYYPVSPPPSHPSSPISSTTRAVNTNVFCWPEDNIPELPSEAFVQQHLHQHTLAKTGRSKSQPSGESKNQQSPLPNNRLRSQSNPNLMKNATTVSQIMESLPPLRQPIGKPSEPEMKPSTSTRLADIVMTPSSTTSTPTSSSGAMKVKLNFNNNIYVIVTNQNITFYDLMEKIDRKIRLIANLKPTDVLRLKYQDEERDFITINSDDDVQMAFEAGGSTNTANLFVSI